MLEGTRKYMPRAKAKKTQDIAPVIIKHTGPKPVAIIFALIITAALVGGIVFVGQQRILNKNKEELEESKNRISVLQSQLNQLQDVVNADIQEQQTGVKYYNEQYGFSLLIPEYWNNYETKERQLLLDAGKFDSVDFYYDKDEPVFNIAMIDKNKWEDSQKLDYYKPVKLNENEKYVFAFSFHKDAEQSLIESLRTDMERIVSTFQFESIPQAQINIGTCNGNFSIKDGETKINITTFNNKNVNSSVRGCFHKNPDVLKTTGKYVYFAFKPEEVGGYMLYGQYASFYRVNLENSKIENMFSNLEESFLITDIDISSDASLAVYRIVSEENNEFIVKNLATMKDSKYQLPVSGSDMQFGDFKFSPDSSKLAIAIGYGSDRERGRGAIYILDLSSKKFSSYQVFDSGVPRIGSWKDDKNLNLQYLK